MSLPEELEGARIIIEKCANVKSTEHVAVVGDWQSDDVTERLAAAARMTGAEASVHLMAPRDEDGNEPPEPITGAMLDADVVVLVPTKAIAHSAAAKRALDSGTRIVAMAKLSLGELLADGLRVDFNEVSEEVQEMADRFEDADTARLTAANGTDVTFPLDDRAGNGLNCTVHEPGEFTVAYCAEANITPTPGKTNGQVVFDGSIPNLGIGLLRDKITMEIKDGRVVSIDGIESERVEAIWQRYDDPAVREVAELAVGLNPCCTELTGGFINDRGVYGTVHIGFGTSSNLGGENRTPLHFDCTLQSATLELDGETIVQDRELNL